MTIGTLIAFTTLQNGLFQPLTGLLSTGVSVVSSLALFARIFEYLDLPVEISDPLHPVEIDPAAIAGHVTFSGVSFRYPGVTGFAAAVLGDNTGYAIGRFGGRTLVLRFGRYVMLTEERLSRAESFFTRHGGKIVTVARFIEVLRQANGIIAGITRMPWLRFLAFNALGAALWVGTWTTAGYLAGNHIQAIYTQANRYALYLLAAAAAAIVAQVIRHRRRRARREAASRETAATTHDARA